MLLCHGDSNTLSPKNTVSAGLKKKKKKKGRTRNIRNISMRRELSQEGVAIQRNPVPDWVFGIIIFYKAQN